MSVLTSPTFGRNFRVPQNPQAVGYDSALLQTAINLSMYSIVDQKAVLDPNGTGWNYKLGDPFIGMVNVALERLASQNPLFVSLSQAGTDAVLSVLDQTIGNQDIFASARMYICAVLESQTQLIKLKTSQTIADSLGLNSTQQGTSALAVDSSLWVGNTR